MSKYILHKEDSRHHEYNDWLESKKTFSFADYYNPKRIHFGALRVFNDDVVKATKGFGKHPHDNMEIISIPLQGSLIHKDNLGNEEVIRAGEIQVMSTGSGVFHSEYNHETAEDTRFLQIWIYPAALNVAPHYSRLTLQDAWFDNQFGTFVAPVASQKAAMIQQDAYLSMGKFNGDKEFTYTIQQNGNGAYLYVIDGSIDIDGHVLSSGDALGISDTAAFKGQVKSSSATILVIDVPMNIQL
ncbi:pirin family protein [Chitinophaga sp. sic0106]|uniref:pirin family protein n=1 Tax=Chitinophaga sp. sic0106 TaxID=2854785 RepID=UPI001C43AF65|nr:pirin family protein [Chitinophaga sp. sic0106]MBV7531035.1 pirin family protein [Chitinophaga sp. sic0106]